MHKTLTLNESLRTEELQNFLKVAREYCELIENISLGNPIGFLKATRTQLISLYKYGLDLPHIDIQSDQDFDDLLTEFDYLQIVGALNSCIYETNYYWHIYDPSNPDEKEPVLGMLSDDLGDIYRDIKRSLLILDINTDVAKENAIWNLWFSFRNHFGGHVINALYAIHFFLQHE